jgi:hypothetical protein
VLPPPFPLPHRDDNTGKNRKGDMMSESKQKAAARQALDNMLAVEKPSNDDDLYIALMCAEGKYFSAVVADRADVERYCINADESLTKEGCPVNDKWRAGLAGDFIRAVLVGGTLEQTDDQLLRLVVYLIAKMQSPEQIRGAVGFVLFLDEDGTHGQTCNTLEEYKAECARLNIMIP